MGKGSAASTRLKFKLTHYLVLLCGGDKASQARDIEKAKALAAGLEG